MQIALWIVSGLLAALFLMAGIAKMSTPKEKLAEKMAWVNDYSPTGVKLVGLAEALGGIGLILPQLTGILPVLTPLAATGLAIVMVLAIVWHVRHDDAKAIGMNIVLLAASLFVAVFRFIGL
ncbi:MULTISPECIES: DoxX family protein [unclassified Leucobacter]|uniref:DoxX family protein n=1 Tax=unclassified Leucobacter TaxID=2621730 RepID=UPI0006211879|nr:DoxX family protein [Leucobacter sp. Ag1]KKI21364.1 hypothetical protein XM48_05425 [Leucobacter sp. Ag1]